MRDQSWNRFLQLIWYLITDQLVWNGSSFDTACQTGSIRKVLLSVWPIAME